MNRFGKRIGSTLYLHRDACDLLDLSAQKRLATARQFVCNQPWNVLKLSTRYVSFLRYEDFDEVGFPALLSAWTVDLTSGTSSHTDYASRTNPPILHRKELLLRPEDPRRPLFAGLTRAAEGYGLFHDSKRIGTREAWKARLDAAGLVVTGQKLAPRGALVLDVARHKTAIVRSDLSQPVSLMLRWGVIEQGISIFDYGCGQGGDVAALQANGYEAFGWDPHHAPNGPRQAADVVNLGFVLNVIEDPFERLETLRTAWSFAERALTVAVMVPGKQAIAGLRPYKDGYLTSRGTFQRYFPHEELRELVESAIGERALTLAPGIVTLFRDKELEQEVAYRKRSRAAFIADGFEIPKRPPAVAPMPQSVRERIAGELIEIWKSALSLGRAPEPGELNSEIRERLAAERVSFQRAVLLAMGGTFDRKLLEEAAAARRDDLLVHFALSLFPGAPKYATLSKSVRRDVKTFFRSHNAALENAQRLLFSVGKPEVICTAAQAAEQAGLGGLVGNRTFRFKTSALPRLPAPLRVMVGCAEVLRDDVLDADFVDISLSGPMVDAIYCDDGSRHFPEIRKVVEVDLQGLRSRRRSTNASVLYLKGRYLPHDDKSRPAQARLDAQLLARGIVTGEGEGPSYPELSRLLAPDIASSSGSAISVAGHEVT